ncbi:MAG: hypothetical protein NT037_07045 [Hyphomicrobiales bacterium]|nr:hypothetical protein [Hyphomicrobiales bacterium]
MRPAPYLASRGRIGLQRISGEVLDDTAPQDHLRESDRLAALNLPKFLPKFLPKCLQRDPGVKLPDKGRAAPG